VKRGSDPSVYFVRRADGEGPVKIGCSQSPLTRLAQLTYWAPYPLVLVASVPGDEQLERRFHAKFAADHSHSEWFQPSQELSRVVAASVRLTSGRWSGSLSGLDGFAHGATHSHPKLAPLSTAIWPDPNMGRGA
jgi:hypothetical protein